MNYRIENCFLTTSTQGNPFMIDLIYCLLEWLSCQTNGLFIAHYTQGQFFSILSIYFDTFIYVTCNIKTILDCIRVRWTV